MTAGPPTPGPADDSMLLLVIAGTWLVIAGLYFLVPILAMPPGQRVWTASGILFAILAVGVMVAEARGAGPS